MGEKMHASMEETYLLNMKLSDGQMYRAGSVLPNGYEITPSESLSERKRITQEVEDLSVIQERSLSRRRQKETGALENPPPQSNGYYYSKPCRAMREAYGWET